MSLRSRISPVPSPGMGSASRTDAVNPGNPLTIPKKLAQSGDQARGTVLETPVITVAIAYLWHKTMIEGDERRSWSVGDVLFVLIIAQAIKRIGVSHRWGGR